MIKFLSFFYRFVPIWLKSIDLDKYYNHGELVD
jgi:hypothetical protein